MKLELDVNSPQNSFINNSSITSEPNDVKEMLRSGIRLAKEGNRAEARQLLLRVTELESSNETAWLWLASISEYPEELLIFLQNVLNINPVNERALEWAKATKTLLSKTLVQRGINASHENQKEFAKQCFLQAIVHDAENEMAWLWLASASDSTEEKISHLQKVLSIDPHNETALSSLKAVKNQMSQGLLKKANSAAIAGERVTAREILDEVMRQTPEMEDAWILQAYLTDGFYAKIDCYEKVLSLNPQNEAAQAGLSSLKALIEKSSEQKPVESNLPVVEEKVEEIHQEQVSFAEESQIDEKPETFENPEDISLKFDADENVNDKSEFISEESLAEPVESVEETSFVAQEETVEANHSEFKTNETKEWDVTIPEIASENISDNESQIDENAAVSDFKYNFEQHENENLLIEDTIIPNIEDKYSFSTDDSVDKNDVQNQVLQMDEEFELFNADATETSFQEFADSPAISNNHIEETAPNIESNELFSDRTPAFEESNQVEEFSDTYQYSEQVEIVEDEKPVFETVESFENSPSDLTQDHISANQVADYLYSENSNEFPSATNEEKESPVEASDFHQIADYSATNYSDNSTFVPQNINHEQISNFETAQQISASPSYFEALSEKTYAAEQSYFEKETFANDVETESFESQDSVQENNFDKYHQEFSNYQEPVNAESFEVVQDEVVEASEPIQEFQPEVAENSSYPEVEIFNCPFCQAENENLSIVCHSCRSMLTLSDLEMMLSHQEADQDVILQAIEKLEIEKSLRDFDDKELTNLGIAHLNAKNYRKGYTYLFDASQLNPNDVVLSSKVNALAIRLNEIEEQENKAQEHPVVSKTIMVVDDSPTVRKLITGKLEKCGHSVISAVDGMDALAKINEVIPDIVLLDITMPRLDGYQVCKLIRNNEITKDIPIVMISGKDGFFDKVRGRMAGSTGYITKPFGPDTLMKTIETYLN